MCIPDGALEQAGWLIYPTRIQKTKHCREGGGDKMQIASNVFCNLDRFGDPLKLNSLVQSRTTQSKLFYYF